MNNLIDTSCRYTRSLGKPVLAYTHRLKKFFQQNFAWMNRR